MKVSAHRFLWGLIALLLILLCISPLYYKWVPDIYEDIKPGWKPIYLWQETKIWIFILPMYMSFPLWYWAKTKPWKTLGAALAFGSSILSLIIGIGFRLAAIDSAVSIGSYIPLFFLPLAIALMIIENKQKKHRNKLN